MTAALLLVSAVLSQDVPTVSLGRADARSSDGFTSIFAVHELPDGRVLMTDNYDRVIRLVDLTAGTVRELGRKGQGPLEYESAYTFVRGAGDTVLVTDNSLRRFVQVVRGEIVGTQLQPDILRSLSRRGLGRCRPAVAGAHPAPVTAGSFPRRASRSTNTAVVNSKCSPHVRAAVACPFGASLILSE